MSFTTACAVVLASTVMALTSANAEPAQEIAGAGAVIEEYLEANHIDEKQLALGWLDLETGESYYVNKDEEFYGASVYKVALNMYWAEKVANGEATWDTLVGGGRLETLMTGSLEQSNNNYSYKLYQPLGAYRASKLAVAHYYGMTVEEAQADRKYWTDSYITPRRMITCLYTLYSQNERFPTVIDHLLAAQPGRYFRLYEDRWHIAQKYGYFSKFGRDVSTAGIVYAPEPFLLVILTHNLPKAEEHIGALCVRLGDYVSGETFTLPES